MKAFTIYQPWASLIVCLAKPYEFRGWAPPAWLIGQRIVIHASTRPIRADEVYGIVTALRRGGADAAATCLDVEKALALLLPVLDLPQRQWKERLPLGAGLGTALVGAGRNGIDIAEEFGLPRVNDSDRDEHANFGWPMREVEAWPEPIGMRGAQGLWDWQTPSTVGLF